MRLTNAQITQEIQRISERLIQYLNESRQPNPSQTIDTLLANWQNLRQLDNSFKSLNSGKSLITPKYLDYDDQLLSVISLHLEAIKAGYQSVTQPKQKVNVYVKEVNYYANYYQPRPWYHDYFLMSLLMDSHRAPSAPNRPSQQAHTREQSAEEQKAKLGIGAILALIALSGAALVSSLYVAIQTVKTLDEIFHGENLSANFSKLGITGLAAFSGAMVGLLLGASAFAMPIVGAVLTACVFAGISYKLCNLAQQNMTQSEHNQSAIDGDNRFKLTAKEEQGIAAKNLNPLMVKEALRELGIQYQQNRANSLRFWGSEAKHQREIIHLVRELKSGNYPENTIQIGRDKLFVLDRPTAAVVPPPSSEPVSQDAANQPSLYSSPYQEPMPTAPGFGGSPS